MGRFGKIMDQHCVNHAYINFSVFFCQCDGENLRNRKQQEMLNNRYFIAVCVCMYLLSYSLNYYRIDIKHGKICLCARI